MDYLARVLLSVAVVCGALSAHAETFFSDDQVKAELFPGAEFVEQQFDIDRSLLKDIRKATSARLLADTIRAWEVHKNGQLHGWLFTAEVLGKHENIRYALALDAEGSISGLEIMDYRETRGYEVRQENWRSSFNGKNLSNANFRLGRDVDNISGATLSCRHLTDGIHGLLMLHQRLLSNKRQVTLARKS